MHSLGREFRKLDVSLPSRREDVRNTREPSAKSTAAESLTPLNLFIRDLDKQKGKLPCCQEVIDIQTSVEKFLKALLLEIEKANPFYKTTLINSGSFYEGTKIGKPDEFDYLVQLDNFSRPEDIRVQELAQCMVAVIPNESAFRKLSKANPSLCTFEWKGSVKVPFCEALESKLVKGFKAFGLTVLSTETRGMIHELRINGPAYTLDLEWTGGKLYRGLNIAVDLVFAVKINSRSLTMNVDFESQAGRIVRSLLYTDVPHYFAISGYKNYRVSPSDLFEDWKESQKYRKRDFGIPLTIKSQSDCLLRCSQSCLEQSLFRDHFGPDGGPSVCLRVLKVLRDMTGPLDQHQLCQCRYRFDERRSVDKNVWEFVTSHKEITKRHSLCGVTEPDSSKVISSYTFKTLVLFEWSRNPEDKQWTGSNLTQRLVNIVTGLLHSLKQEKKIRSFWYNDYNVLPSRAINTPKAINRVTIFLQCLSSLRSQNGNYCFEDCVQTIENLVTLALHKMTLTTFLSSALQNIFCDKVKEILEESIGKKNLFSAIVPRDLPRGLVVRQFDCGSQASIYSEIYVQALLEKIAPDEKLILTSPHFEWKKDMMLVRTGLFGPDIVARKRVEEIVKNARDLFEEISRNRMNDLDNLPDYCLWSRDFKFDEVASLLKFLCKNFNEDIEILRYKIKTGRIKKVCNGVVT